MHFARVLHAAKSNRAGVEATYIQAQTATMSQASEDFSLVLGGPLYQLLRRAFLSGRDLELLQRRIFVIPLIAWLPLLLLSAVEGRAWGGSVRVPFLLDIDVHARFLLALPLFILAEVVVHPSPFVPSGG